MWFSRRKFMAGAAVAAAVAAPAHLYRQYRKREEAALDTEPELVAPSAAEELLAERLIGIWDLRWVTDARALGQLPAAGAELLLDVGPSGRAVRGYFGLPPYEHGGFQIFGGLEPDRWSQLRWKLTGADGQWFECTATFDEAWGAWSTGGGEATLSGRIHRAGVQHGHSCAHADFVAIRRPFVEARHRLPYDERLEAWLVSPGHRLFHQLWHASRDEWHGLERDKQDALRGLGWQPGPRNAERAARGKDRLDNGSGEDFLFMHRQMLQHARALQPLPSWTHLPAPRPYIGHGVKAFADYVSNRDGYSVPPTWDAEDDDEFNIWLRNIKSSRGYFGNFQLWEALYQNPDYLSTLCLGELGTHIELGIHDWLHMCWASICRDPANGLPLPYERSPVDFSDRWFRPEHDYLGSAFSSHVNPVFWAFHGWIDERVEDWFLAHEQAHPGEVVRAELDGVPWFAPGPWVRIADPWLGPAEAGCGAWGRSNGGGTPAFDTETMKLALRILFAEDDEMARLGKRVARRPWYGRHLPAGPPVRLPAA